MHVKDKGNIMDDRVAIEETGHINSFKRLMKSV